jgi:hypothetical protein
MSRIQAKPNTSLHRRIAVLCVLTLAACSQGHIQEPWTGGDPHWKQSHFASQTPDAELRARAATTQIDR